MLIKNKKLKQLFLCSCVLVFLGFLANIFVINSALAECEEGFICFENPWGKSEAARDPRILAGSIIRIALGLLGSFFLVMITIGGYMWIFSAGNQEKFKKGKDLLVWSVAGLAVALAAYGILSWVMSNVLEGIGGGR